VYLDGDDPDSRNAALEVFQDGFRVVARTDTIHHPIVIKMALVMNTVVRNIRGAADRDVYGLTVRQQRARINATILVDTDVVARAGDGAAITSGWAMDGAASRVEVPPAVGDDATNSIIQYGYVGDDDFRPEDENFYPQPFKFGLSDDYVDNPERVMFDAYVNNTLRATLKQDEDRFTTTWFKMILPLRTYLVENDSFCDQSWRNNQPWHWNGRPRIDLDATLVVKPLVERFTRHFQHNTMYQDPTHVDLYPEFVASGRLRVTGSPAIVLSYFIGPSKWEYFRILSTSDWVSDTS